MMIDQCLVVTITVSGDGCPLAEATNATERRIESEPPQRRSDGSTLLRFSGSDPHDALADALDADDRIRYLHTVRVGERTDFRCVSVESCVVDRLVDAGLLVESIEYDTGGERYTGAVIGRDVLEDVLQAAGETVGVSVERIYPLGPDDEPTIAERWDLTPAQGDALRTAWTLGYFTVPREVTASEVADALDISKTAFLERLKRGQDQLFEHLFVDRERHPRAPE